ncbi:2-phospho-L-lactate guanylyltransferase [Actinotalea sp. M2MS4P-6]|uniref:2-phospho-L-lactate guanylyltransferase n=1 Tax=Actinotalea sp. M2MS4P-6 TaxID=2983762 RepID=UPI0021E3B04D|nr:2-phospho-L-lactate guanylyltransferase [Actinotalea sp. M2MS4P-6]MCV2396045.1 2-phospho-L-lactate guanylyltransferase [Actinotalea sp. M2MS4P-6]
MSERWTLVLPVKRLEAAKSRLDVAADARAELALAFALDTLAAVAACEQVEDVVVVTSEPRVPEIGIRVVADPGGGLLAAIGAGLAAVAQDRPVAVLLGDLPALRPEELDAALAAAARHRSAMVADLDGTGTTLLTARRAADLDPRFGPGSRAAHEAAGHVLLDAGDGLRRDVDTAADLAAVVRLGVGPATAAVIAAVSPLQP